MQGKSAHFLVNSVQLGQLGNLVILEVLVSWGRDGRFRPVALGE
jgi:hypothetical protein